MKNLETQVEIPKIEDREKEKLKGRYQFSLYNIFNFTTTMAVYFVIVSPFYNQYLKNIKEYDMTSFSGRIMYKFFPLAIPTLMVILPNVMIELNNFKKNRK